MAALMTKGALRAGLAAPERAHTDEPLGLLEQREGFWEGQRTADTRQSTAENQRKRAAKLQAQAALLGLALHVGESGACLLIGEAGRRSDLPSLQAAEALVYGMEAVRSEVRAMLNGLTAGDVQ